MTTATDPASDYQDFTKFCKFFTIRLVQAVVQSRLGEKIKTDCQVEGSARDWFNVRIDELGEVTGEIRAATDGRFPPECNSICLFFQLQTSEGEFLPLESWCISFDSSKCHSDVGIRSKLYHQMSILLRSAIAASRVTPVYRYYSRKQGPESFIICYQILEGNPDLAQLGDGHKSVQLGSLPCIYGTLNLHLHYRTKMVIGDHQGSGESTPTKDGENDEAAMFNRSVHVAGDGGMNSNNGNNKKSPRPVQACSRPTPATAAPDTLHDDSNTLKPASVSPSDNCFSMFSTSPPSDIPVWAPLASINCHPSSAATPVPSGGCSSSGGSMSSHSKSSQSHSCGNERKDSSSNAIFNMDLSQSGSLEGIPKHVNATAAEQQTHQQPTFISTSSSSSASHLPSQQQQMFPLLSNIKEKTPEPMHSGCGDDDGPLSVPVPASSSGNNDVNNSPFPGACDNNFPFGALLTASSAPPSISSTNPAGHPAQDHQFSTASSINQPLSTNSDLSTTTTTTTAGGSTLTHQQQQQQRLDGVRSASPEKTILSPAGLSPAKKPVGRILEHSRENESGVDDEDDDDGLDDVDSDDSFVKVDPLFLPAHDLGSDLSKFVEECKTAPAALVSFDYPPPCPAVIVNDTHMAAHLLGMDESESSEQSSAARNEQQQGGAVATQTGETETSATSLSSPTTADLTNQISVFANLQVAFDDFVQNINTAAEEENEDD